MPGAVFFNARCNEQEFSPKPCKKLAQMHLVVLEKNAKTGNSDTLQLKKKMMSPSRKLGYSNNQLNC